jgi:chloramphenicol-sensitive protein RarD
VDRKTYRDGLIYGISSYVLWGLIPLYFKPLAKAGVGSPEVLAHRVVWSFLLFAAVVTASGRWREFWRALASRKTTLTLVITTLLIGLNWLTFLYAISSDQVLQASLAYFATPLLNVLLGVVFLKERLRPYQIVALGLAAIGLGCLAGLSGQLPWIAVTLAVSFAFYGLLRKTVAVDGVMGLLFETMMLSPLGLAYIAYVHGTGLAAFHAKGWEVDLMLIASGVPTAIPLLLFAAAVRRMQLSTLGILQYLAPTIQFFLAVAVFHEEFHSRQLISFAFIWVAVAIYCADSWRQFRKGAAASRVPAGAETPDIIQEPAAGLELDA